MYARLAKRNYQYRLGWFHLCWTVSIVTLPWLHTHISENILPACGAMDLHIRQTKISREWKRWRKVIRTLFYSLTCSNRVFSISEQILLLLPWFLINLSIRKFLPNSFLIKQNWLNVQLKDFYKILCPIFQNERLTPNQHKLSSLGKGTWRNYWNQDTLLHS